MRPTWDGPHVGHTNLVIWDVRLLYGNHLNINISKTKTSEQPISPYTQLFTFFFAYILCNQMYVSRLLQTMFCKWPSCGTFTCLCWYTSRFCPRPVLLCLNDHADNWVGNPKLLKLRNSSTFVNRDYPVIQLSCFPSFGLTLKHRTPGHLIHEKYWQWQFSNLCGTWNCEPYSYCGLTDESHLS